MKNKVISIPGTILVLTVLITLTLAVWGIWFSVQTSTQSILTHRLQEKTLALAKALGQHSQIRPESITQIQQRFTTSGNLQTINPQDHGFTTVAIIGRDQKIHAAAGDVSILATPLATTQTLLTAALADTQLLLQQSHSLYKSASGDFYKVVAIPLQHQTKLFSLVLASPLQLKQEFAAAHDLTWYLVDQRLTPQKLFATSDNVGEGLFKEELERDLLVLEQESIVRPIFTTDRTGNALLACSKFIPEIDLTLITTKPVAADLKIATLLKHLAIALSLLSALILLALFFSLARYFFEQRSTQPDIKYRLTLQMLTVMCAGLFFITGQREEQVYRQAFSSYQAETAVSLATSGQKIDYEIFATERQIEQLAQSRSFITNRTEALNTLLQDLPSINKVTVHEHTNTLTIERAHDGLQKTTSDLELRTPGWHYLDLGAPKENTHALYCFETTVEGKHIALTAHITIPALTNIVADLFTAEHGLVLAVDNSQRIVYEGIEGDITRNTIVRLLKTEQFNQLIQEATKKASGSFTLPINGKTLLVWFTKLAALPITLVACTLAQDVHIEAASLYTLKLLQTASLVGFCLALFFSIFSLFAASSLRTLIGRTIPTLIAAAGIIATWHYAQTLRDMRSEGFVQVDSQADIELYLNKLYALGSLPSNTTQIPTQLIVTSASFNKEGGVDLVGEAILKVPYQLVEQGFNPQLRFLSASKVTFTTSKKVRLGNTQEFVWNFKARMLPKNDFRHFPIDKQLIQLFVDIEPTPFNVVCVPDCDHLSFYNGGSPIGGFNVAQARSGFAKNSFELSTTRRPEILCYNLVLNRLISYSLIAYFLPLLLIFLTLFMLLDLQLFDLTTFTSTLFSVILMHANIRTTLQPGMLTYVEYFILYAYLTTLMQMLLGFTQILSKETTDRVNRAFVNLFWPAQAIIWLLTTLWLFWSAGV